MKRECYGVNWGPLECPDTSALKGKTKQKPQEVEEAREGKTAQPGKTRATTVVGLTTA